MILYYLNIKNMKKIITLLLIVFISINNTFAYNNYVLTDEDIKTTEALVEAIENIIDDK
jgi:CRISPR/Cas system-associated exonuclease Cas4 (RecB family)